MPVEEEVRHRDVSIMLFLVISSNGKMSKFAHIKILML